MKLDTTSPKIEERIYIGGLNPPRLNGREIVRRLKLLDEIEIESSSILDNNNDEDDGSENDWTSDDNKPYLHITAISKHESHSALSIIHKHYHNVKWKGCKLVVESAKPHFLERLEQERRDRQIKLKEMASLSAKDQEVNESEAPSRIPRRLRVRKKHGDTAVHIDTTPWTVETWSRFKHARTKLKKREEKYHESFLAGNNKHSAAESFSSPGPLMHRAVHIRFQKEENNVVDLNGKVSPSTNDNAIGETMTSSNGSSSVSSSSESESESESESSNDGIIDKNESSTKPFSERYEWSDDDSDSEDSKENGNDQHTSFQSWDYQQPISVKLSGANEFEAGLEDASTSSLNDNNDLGDHEISKHRNQGENDDMESDLIGDVATNLNILSSIFPDMANTKPINPNCEDDSKLDNETIDSSSGTKKKNPNLVHGIMPRFDPSANSSRKYIVEKESTEEKEGQNSTNSLSSEEKPDDDMMDEDKSENSDDTQAQKETTAKVQQEPSIYEQDKLENVFRQARNTWGVEDNNSTVPSTSEENVNAESPSDKKPFSFGFNLLDANSDNIQKQQTSESNSEEKPFSFSFEVPDQDQGGAKTISAITDNLTTDHRDSNNSQTATMLSSQNDSKAGNVDSANDTAAIDVVKRQKGLTLADEDLQKYVDNFFACNDGVRIMQNPQEFMNDDNDRAVWNSERQTLTLDWKRKRKYAITRIQKRMKIRRR